MLLQPEGGSNAPRSVFFRSGSSRMSNWADFYFVKQEMRSAANQTIRTQHIIINQGSALVRPYFLDMLMNNIIYKIVAVREESKPWDFTFVLRMTSPSDASFSVFLLVAKFVCDTHDSFDVDLYCGCFTLRRNTS